MEPTKLLVGSGTLTLGVASVVVGYIMIAAIIGAFVWAGTKPIEYLDKKLDKIIEE